MFFKASPQDSHFYDDHCKGEWILFEFQCPIDFGWELLVPTHGIARHICEAYHNDMCVDLVYFGAFLQRITTSGDASGDFTETPRAIALPTSKNQIEFIGLVWKEDGGMTYVALKSKYAALAETMLQGETPLREITKITL